MTPTLQLVLLIGIIILAAKTGGLLSTRLGQPAVLGELLAGLALGPTVIDLLGQPAFAEGHAGEMILELGELGVIFLMFAAGLEVEWEEMARSGRVAIFAGVLGVLVPLVLGAGMALAFGHPWQNSLFIGLILTATSVSISAQTLLELGYLKSKEGLGLLGAAVVDDVLVIVLLSVMLALAGEPGASPSIGVVLVRVGLFIGVATLIGLKILPRLVEWVKRLPVSEGVMAFVIIVTLLYAWTAEVVGLVAAITGAFLAGLYFGRTSVRGTIERGMHALTYAFFVPIFLISIGLKANARVLDAGGVWFAVAIISVAIVGKIVGCGIGARLAGLDWRAALRVGIGMVSRGEVGLIVAAVALSNQLIDQAIYSAMVVMVLATTLVTPLLLRQVFRHKEVARG